MAAIGEKIATREAYGSALAEFGAKYKVKKRQVEYQVEARNIHILSNGLQMVRMSKICLSAKKG